jgi:hypothetical protein
VLRSQPRFCYRSDHANPSEGEPNREQTKQNSEERAGAPPNQPNKSGFLLRSFSEQKCAGQINGGEEDSGQNRATKDRENRIGQLKERSHNWNGGAGTKKSARISHDNGNHPH